MNNFERIKEMSMFELEFFICETVLQGDCDRCPFAKRCCHGWNGVKDWLMDKTEEI